MSLKIPKGQSESVYRRRTDNTMAKRKSTKGQTTYLVIDVLNYNRYRKSASHQSNRHGYGHVCQGC